MSPAYCGACLTRPLMTSGMSRPGGSVRRWSPEGLLPLWPARGGLDQAVGQLLIDTLTPLAAEAALTVTAEFQHRADDAEALRAPHVERASYHAGLARRRYLA